MRPPFSLPSFHSECKCHRLMGCRKTSGFSDVACSRGSLLNFTFSIFFETASKEVVGSISTNVMASVKLISSLFQLFSSSFNQGLDESHVLQLEMNCRE